MKKKTLDNASFFIKLYFYFFLMWTLVFYLFEVGEKGWTYVTFGRIVPFRSSFSHIGLKWRKERARKLKEEQRVAVNVCVSSVDTTTHRETRQWVRSDMCRQHITTLLSIGPHNPSPSYRSQVILRSFFSFLASVSGNSYFVAQPTDQQSHLELRIWNACRISPHGLTSLVLYWIHQAHC